MTYKKVKRRHHVYHSIIIPDEPPTSEAEQSTRRLPRCCVGDVSCSAVRAPGLALPLPWFDGGPWRVSEQVRNGFGGLEGHTGRRLFSLTMRSTSIVIPMT